MADKGHRKPGRPRKKPGSTPRPPALEEPPGGLGSDTPAKGSLPPLIEVEPDGLLHIREREEGPPAFDELFPDDGEGEQPSPAPSVPLETVPAPTLEQPEARTYGCKCGFIAQNPDDLGRHFLSAGRKDGPGIHRSLNAMAKAKGANRMPAAGRPVGNIREAARVRFIPKEFVLEASPILFQAMEVAVNEWHWPAEMTPQDFLETYIYRTMDQLGYVLHGYVKKDEPGPEPASEDRGDGHNQGRVLANSGG